PSIADSVRPSPQVTFSANVCPSAELDNQEYDERDYQERYQRVRKVADSEWSCHDGVDITEPRECQGNDREYQVVHERLDQGTQINAEDEGDRESEHLVL